MDGMRFVMMVDDEVHETDGQTQKKIRFVESCVIIESIQKQI